MDKRIIISKEGFKNLIEESKDKYKQILDRLEELIKENIPLIDKSTRKAIEELKIKLNL